MSEDTKDKLYIVALRHCWGCEHASFRNPKFKNDLIRNNHNRKKRRNHQGTVRCEHPDITDRKNNIVINSHNEFVNILIYGACKLGKRKTTIAFFPNPPPF